ncbi:MAG TPA: crosslink repair DNA glycosylase YcaQ family protein [Gaiellaceae bacterium]|nr:crosslink repair DNA glycosylase YcaQ family protein [Gaiellaceae bacterium]
MSDDKPVEVTREDARRVAVRAQLLDGSGTDVLETVRHLGFLQMDPISTVAAPQYLVLWSRLGRHDRAALDRLLWEEKKLFEWNAFIWPIEALPLIRARMREPWGHYKWQRWAKEFLKEQARLRRYVLRELERRGPLLSRELEHPAARANERYVWWGTRAQLTWMLGLLHRRGLIAVAGRRGGERLWDLAERWYPETETVPLAQARRILEEKRFRAVGVKLENGRWLAHPHADARPVRPRLTFLSPFDRLVYDRDRAQALWDFRYRLEMYVPKAKREYGYYVLPILRGDRLIGRIEPVVDRKEGVLHVNNVWWEDGARCVSLERPLRSLARFVGAKKIEA